MSKLLKGLWLSAAASMALGVNTAGANAASLGSAVLRADIDVAQSHVTHVGYRRYSRGYRRYYIRERYRPAPPPVVYYPPPVVYYPPPVIVYRAPAVGPYYGVTYGHRRVVPYYRPYFPRVRYYNRW